MPQPSRQTRVRDPLNVVALAYDGLCTFELGVVVEVFGLPRPEFDPWYSFRLATVQSGPLRAVGGFTIEVAGGLRLLDRAGTILVPGWRTDGRAAPPTLLNKLRRAHDAGARVLSVCSGAFLLAEAGLLDGRRATTHWRYAEELARRFPAVTVDSDVLYVDAGNVLTSAGSAAGIDLGLHLVARDFGAETANSVARRLVVQPHRDGGQKQFVERPLAPSNDEGDLAALLDAVRQRLQEAHTVESMARLVHLSPRTFARRFRAAVGSTPHRWLVAERVRLARELLETSECSIDELASSCGFSDAQTLRLHFKRAVGSSPSAYRRVFRRAQSPGVHGSSE